MRIYVDADACPVKGIIVTEAKKKNIEVIMVCDTSHIINDDFSKIVTVDKFANSADLVISNEVKCGDVVVTQDFGLAAIVLSKGAFALNQNGLIYSNENIDRLLFERFLAKKSRKIGKKTQNMTKRTLNDDENFRINFRKLIER